MEKRMKEKCRAVIKREFFYHTSVLFETSDKPSERNRKTCLEVRDMPAADPCVMFWVILQTNKQTDKHKKHNFLGGGKYNRPKYINTYSRL